MNMKKNTHDLLHYIQYYAWRLYCDFFFPTVISTVFVYFSLNARWLILLSMVGTKSAFNTTSFIFHDFQNINFCPYSFFFFFFLTRYWTCACIIQTLHFLFLFWFDGVYCFQMCLVLFPKCKFTLNVCMWEN